MSSNTWSWRSWLLPFVVSGGMALGAFIGLNCVSDAPRQEGPSGDMAGAAEALMVAICILVGFVMPTLTLVVSRVLRRAGPRHLAIRLGLSIVSGGVVGAVSWQSRSGPLMAAIAWVLLLGAPVLLSWSWRARAVLAPDAPPIE